MALDSRDKRASALGVAVATFALVLPNPDGAALNQGDRQQVAFCYRGIAASAAANLGSAPFRRSWVLQERVTTWDVDLRRTVWTVPDRATTWFVQED